MRMNIRSSSGAKRALGAALGLCLLAGGIATAGSHRAQGERSCPDRCAKKLKECSAACKESAGSAAPTCIQACQQADQKCMIKC
jgi:hypothetical protein